MKKIGKKKEQKLFNTIIKNANYVKYMFDSFNSIDTILSYRWMLNLSDKVIGIFYNTSPLYRGVLDYAKRKSVNVENCLFTNYDKINN